MRGLAAAALAALVLSASACGGSGPSAGGLPGTDAARLIPADAIAFASVDAHLDSPEWRTIRALIGPIGLMRDLDYDRVVKPAVGDELNIAVLGSDETEPEVVALVKSKDEAKLRTLASRFDQGDEHYTVERVGDWSVVADSRAAFDAVRAARAGHSLAEEPSFQGASSRLDDLAIGRLYVDGEAAAKLTPRVQALAGAAGDPAWLGASVAADDQSVRVRVALDRTAATPEPYTPRLLDEVPSGASLAISFRGLDELLARLAADPAFESVVSDVREYLGVGVRELAPLLRSEGVLYARGGGILPVLAMELESSRPADAARVLRRVAARLTAKGGALLTLSVSTRPGRLVLATSPQAAAELASSGPKLVDDEVFKSALADADVPDEVTGLVYADIEELLPLVEAAAAAFGDPLPPETRTNLQRIRTLVAYGAADSGSARLDARLQLGSR